MNPSQCSDSLSLEDIPTYQAGVMQAKTFRSLNALFARGLKPYGLTAMQWYVIGIIHDNQSSSIGLSQLANIVGSTLASLNEIVATLEQKGWIIKTNHLSDGRARIVSIAPARRAHVEQIEGDLRDYFRKSIYAKVTRDELTNYVRTLYKLAYL